MFYKMKNSALVILLLLASDVLLAQKPTKIKPERKIYLTIPEPSDVCLHPNGKSLFIVSDNGFLFETDLEGKTLRQADYKGLDCEGVHADEKFVYVVEEFSRKIRVFDIVNLQLQKTVYLEYNGGRNAAYEAITYNPSKGVFLLFVEKNPIYMFELNHDLQKVNEYDLSKISRDISAATFHNDHLWLLGDEDMTVYKLNPKTYQVLNSWKLPVVNPEGLTFDSKCNLLIISDDMQLLFYFKNPEN
jgi:uncharacterized protein YjiK